MIEKAHEALLALHAHYRAQGPASARDAVARAIDELRTAEHAVLVHLDWIASRTMPDGSIGSRVDATRAKLERAS